MHWGQKVTSGLWQERSQFVLHFPGEKLVIRRLNYIIFLYWIIIVNECNMLQFIDCYKTLTNGDKIHLYNKEPEHGFRSVHVLQTYLFHLHWLGLLRLYLKKVTLPNLIQKRNWLETWLIGTTCGTNIDIFLLFSS